MDAVTIAVNALMAARDAEMATKDAEISRLTALLNTYKRAREGYRQRNPDKVLKWRAAERARAQTLRAARTVQLTAQNNAASTENPAIVP